VRGWLICPPRWPHEAKYQPHFGASSSSYLVYFTL
jgi:hypothetical protein